MSDRYEVISFRKTKNGKVFAVKLGTATPRDDGGFSCWLDAIPAPGAYGVYEIQIVKPRERGDAQARDGELNDSIPF